MSTPTPEEPTKEAIGGEVKHGNTTVKIGIDPLEKPVELVQNTANAVVEGSKKAIKKIKGWFK